MKEMILAIMLSIFFVACAPTGEEKITTEGAPQDNPQEENLPSEKKCGDGVCDGPENATNCPADCGDIETSVPQTSMMREGEEAGTYWITNTSSIAPLFTQILQPAGAEAGTSPVIFLIPGGIGTIEPAKAQKLADEGFTVVFFDPDGRGKSRGMEDYNGTIQQDGLASVIRTVAELPEVDATRMGVVSLSYGVTMATGALARNPDLPILFYIDWEGPVNREYTTIGCPAENNRIDWQPCENDEWWATREAMNFIADLQMPYQRLQSEQDHVQPTNDHAIDIVNAAVAGGVPWVRLNDYPANESYDLENQPAMYAENSETSEELIARHVWEILGAR